MLNKMVNKEKLDNKGPMATIGKIIQSTLRGTVRNSS